MYLDGPMYKWTYAFSISTIGDSVIENIESTKLCLVSPGIVVFVNKSTRLNSTGIHSNRKMYAYLDSLTLWQHIAVCLLFNNDVGILRLLTTDMLSKNISAGPSTSIPIILTYNFEIQPHLYQY